MSLTKAQLLSAVAARSLAFESSRLRRISGLYWAFSFRFREFALLEGLSRIRLSVVLESESGDAGDPRSFHNSEEGQLKETTGSVETVLGLLRTSLFGLDAAGPLPFQADTEEWLALAGSHQILPGLSEGGCATAQCFRSVTTC